MRLYKLLGLLCIAARYSSDEGMRWAALSVCARHMACRSSSYRSHPHSFAFLQAVLRFAFLLSLYNYFPRQAYTRLHVSVLQELDVEMAAPRLTAALCCLSCMTVCRVGSLGVVLRRLSV